MENLEEKRLDASTKIVEDQPYSKEYKVLYKTDVSHIGWELDTKLWIVEDSFGRFVIETSHGLPFISTTDSLDEIINDHRAILNGLTLARVFLLGKK